MLDNRYSRAARNIFNELETERSVTVDVSTHEKDSFIFRVMLYLTHYFGKYWIEYYKNGLATIRKQG